MSNMPIGDKITVTTLQENLTLQETKTDEPTTPPLPNPAETLARAQQRFPNVSVDVLKGVRSHSDIPEPLRNLEMQIRQQPRQQGITPVVVGEGSQAKIALMPNKGVRGPDVDRKIQQSVTQGKQLFDQIMAGGHPQRPNKTEVANLMWYLQALGSAKAGQSSGGDNPAMYKEGGLFVEDPNGRLQAFLTNANSYGRSSSHMRDYQALGPDFKSRGVDIRNVETPNNRKTILFARLPRNNEVPQGGPKGTGDKRMLFIKMEPHGCRGLTAKGSGTPREDGVAPSKWKGFKRFFCNAKDLFMHGTGFIKSLGQRVGLVAVEGQNNRERIPSEVRNAYQSVLDQISGTEFTGVPADKAEEARSSIMRALENNAPLSDAGGIKQMLPNLRAAIQAFDALPGAVRDVAPDIGKNLLNLELTLRSHGDHPDMRIGNEVILTSDEMDVGSVAPIKTYDGQGALKAEGKISPEGQQIILAGLQYRLDNIDNVNKVDVFKKDTNRNAYKIGTEGQEAVVDRDTEKAMKAVLALTGDNERVATALMSLTNQSLAADIVGKMMLHGMGTSGVPVTPGNAGEFRIAKLPDNENGEAVYLAEFTVDTKPENVFSESKGGQLQLNADQSSLKCQSQVLVTVHADGSMTPSFGSVPSYSYTLTPQA